MHKRLFTLAAAAVLLASQTAGADEASVRKAFAAKFPKAEVQSVTKLPYLGLYEIVVEGEVLYADENFDYLIDGNIISTKNDEQPDRAEASASSRRFPSPICRSSYAFKKVKGNGERKMAVFSDPDCPFCKRVEGDLAKLDNVTIYMFLYPIESLHPNAPDVAKRIWCSPDKVKAWDDYLLRGIAPRRRRAAARTRWTRSSSSAARRGSTARPTLVFESGARVPGAISAAQIENYLNKKEN